MTVYVILIYVSCLAAGYNYSRIAQDCCGSFSLYFKTISEKCARDIILTLVSVFAFLASAVILQFNTAAAIALSGVGLALNVLCAIFSKGKADCDYSAVIVNEVFIAILCLSGLICPPAVLSMLPLLSVLSVILCQKLIMAIMFKERLADFEKEEKFSDSEVILLITQRKFADHPEEALYDAIDDDKTYILVSDSAGVITKTEPKKSVIIRADYTGVKALCEIMALVKPKIIVFTYKIKKLDKRLTSYLLKANKVYICKNADYSQDNAIKSDDLNEIFAHIANEIKGNKNGN